MLDLRTKNPSKRPRRGRKAVRMFVRTLPKKEGIPHELLCEDCGKFVGNVTSEELFFLAIGSERVLCFECQGRADEIPAVLLSDEIPYWLGFGSEDTQQEPPTFVLIDPWRQARQNQERVDMWAKAFQDFVQDLQTGPESE